MGFFLRELLLFAEVLLIVAPVIVVVGLLRRSAAARRHALEVERLAAMRAAIDKGVLQEADRDALLAAMAGSQAPTAAQSWPVAVGWVAGFVGIEDIPGRITERIVPRDVFDYRLPLGVRLDGGYAAWHQTSSACQGLLYQRARTAIAPTGPPCAEGFQTIWLTDCKVRFFGRRPQRNRGRVGTGAIAPPSCSTGSRGRSLPASAMSGVAQGAPTFRGLCLGGQA